MGSAKRRKISSADDDTRTVCPSSDIRGFGRIAKAGTQTPQHAKKGLEAPEKPFMKAGKDVNIKSNSKHFETVLSVSSGASENTELEVGASDEVANTRSSGRIIRSPVKPSPIASKQKRSFIAKKSVEVTETPTKGARTFLDSFHLSSPRAKRRLTSAADYGEALSEPASQTGTVETDDESSEELRNYQDLFSAFLTATSLYFAHHGVVAPVDLNLLIPSIERTWGKQNIVADDIRRLLGILGSEGCENEESTRLMLSDYGGGRLCLEIVNPAESQSILGRPFDEERLYRIFEKHLKQKWKHFCESSSPGSEEDSASKSVETFVQTLPKVAAPMHPSAQKSSVLFRKGQMRLEEFKMGAIEIKSRQTRLQSSSTEKLSSSPQKRKENMERRMREKQQARAATAPPPSKSATERIAAAHRAAEVVQILAFMSEDGRDADGAPDSKGRQRMSLSIETVLQHVLNSSRNPISREEALRCLTLLAEVIAPEWITVFKLGRVGGIVIRKENRPSDAMLRTGTEKVIRES